MRNRQNADLSPLESGARLCDVAIIGNGAIGLSLGLALARRGVSVTIVGEATRPFAASPAAGAMLGCFGEVGPKTLATPFGRAKLELDYRATQAWPAWLESLTAANPQKSVDELRVATGTFVVHNTIGHPEIDDDSWDAIRQALDEFEEPYEDVDPREIDWLVPQATARPLEAMFIPNEHAIDPGLLLTALERSATHAGAEYISATVNDINSQSGRVTSISLSNGVRIDTRVVVLAAGVNSQKLLDKYPDVARTIPRLVSGPGIAAVLEQSSATPALTSVIRTPNRAFACGLHAVPRTDGRVYVGATNAIRPNPTSNPSVRGLQFLLDCVVRQLRRDLWFSDVTSVIVGNRPVSLDGFPLFGPTGIEGLWMVTGTYRDGFHMSPVLAELMADWILGADQPVELELFRPVRRPIQALTREETISQTVVHRLATGHEFGWSLPVDWPTAMEGMFEAFYRELADGIDPQYTPPPEILSFIPRFPQLRDFLQEYYSEESP